MAICVGVISVLLLAVSCLVVGEEPDVFYDSVSYSSVVTRERQRLYSFVLHSIVPLA